ncbi:IQ and AAA domain-containing protein 1-like isoform X1 [Pieris brassicae]|uniref:IQ and AAA domain-containing protein 1-like isoform X1 n=1 Tax=Pieris brassicae TaxID=7116 RepID=UPI001E65EFD1|nr:IQ and AAA domain-containing protein 1-like isoform X1 [Pieris brassicae]
MCRRKRMYFADNVRVAPLYLRRQAAMLIQKVYRRYMQLKRQRVVDTKRDLLLGLIPDPFRKGLNYEEENNKMYLRKRNIRTKLKETYKTAFEKENTRLVVMKKDDQIDDITDHVRTWFREWFYGYGFFPEYPYEIEGGTVMVIRGLYPTIQEKKEDDERYQASMKGKTKEMLKAEAKQAKLDAIQKELAAKEQKKREAEQLFRLRCNPLSDPGYQPQKSQVMGDIVQVLQKYQAAWSIYDQFPPNKCPEAFFGYMQEILTEDVMGQIHLDCRKYVDELMRLDLKLLIKAHQEMYKSVGWKFPKMPTRKKPKAPPVPKPLKINDGVLESFHKIFDLGLVSKPTNKIKEIIGDLNFYAYDVNIRDPNAKFPPPSYGDIRRRLILSCVYGSGIEPGATRNKAVMLLGPQRNGKSFLVDTVCGELNAVKIDITPEVFTAHVDKPAKALTEVFLAAKVFQPTVIYMRNIERVFCKKVAPEDKYLQAKAMAGPLSKLIKQMIPEDKVIFIATCSSPLIAQTKPMVTLFNEIILVPRTDYNSLRTFFYDRLQMIRSMPRDYCVQALAQVLQGYGFGVIVEVFNRVLTPERIVRLNVTPLTPAEFLDPIFQIGLEATTMEEYQEFVDFYIANSPLSMERPQFEKINSIRAVLYDKLVKKTQS